METDSPLLQEISCNYSKSNLSDDCRYNRYEVHLNNKAITQTPYQIPIISNPRQPLDKSLFPIRPSNDPYWTKVWYSCHSKLVPGFTRTIAWRCVSLSYKLAKRSNKDSPFYNCPICKTVPNTTLHKYFFCPSISPLWNHINLWLDPFFNLVFLPPVDLFFLRKQIPESLGIIAFHSTLSVVHSHFLRASFQGSVTTLPVVLEILQSTLQAHINRVWHSHDS